MSIRKLASSVLLIAGAAWLVKVALIAGSGGSNTSEGLVALAYFAGLLGLLAGAGFAGWAIAGRRTLWLRATIAVAGVVLAFVAMQLVDVAAKLVYTTPNWQRGEVGIVLVALAALSVGGWLTRPAPE